MLPSIALLSIIMPEWLSFYYEAVRMPPLYWTTPTAGTFLRLTFLGGWPQVHFLPAVCTGLLFIGFLLKKRPMLIWKKVVPPLLLISLPTASFGWSFDQIILLIPYLYVVVIVFGDEGKPGRISRFLLALGLFIIEIGMLMQRIFVTEINDLFYDVVQLDYFYETTRGLRLSHELFYFWVPLTLGVLYVAAYARAKNSASFA
jgi:hypothetical protein